MQGHVVSQQPSMPSSSSFPANHHSASVLEPSPRFQLPQRQQSPMPDNSLLHVKSEHKPPVSPQQFISIHHQLLQQVNQSSLALTPPHAEMLDDSLNQTPEPNTSTNSRIRKAQTSISDHSSKKIKSMESAAVLNSQTVDFDQDGPESTLFEECVRRYDRSGGSRYPVCCAPFSSIYDLEYVNGRVFISKDYFFSVWSCHP